MKLLGAPSHKRTRMRHVALDVVQLLPLRLHHRRHVQKNLVQFHQVLLNLLNGVVPLLNLRNRVHYLTPPLLLNRPLQKALALPTRYQILDCFLLRLLPRDREVPPF
ncbi:hypothetical protein V8G54_003743, partial [Vigna mungo]